MEKSNPENNYYARAMKILLSLFIVALVSSACAEPSPSPATQETGQTNESVDGLRSKVAEIEQESETPHSKADAAGEHDHDETKMPKDQGMAMGKDAKAKGMGMGMGMHGKGKGMKMKGMDMDSKDQGMAMGKDAKAKGMGMGMGMHGKGEGMMKMMGMMHGDMKMMKMGDQKLPSSALPGFPGVSHIYHVGATGFFLDHTGHLQLSDDQRAKLEALKEQSQKQQDDFQLKVEEAEKEVWKLTSSDQPDIQKILDKVKQSEALKTEKRLAFIRAVGEAATVLSPEQRKLLTSPSDTEDASETEPHSH